MVGASCFKLSGVEPRVSVIVPTYRSGSHLDQTVRSLDRQTLPEHQFEVIFVDDGSPDGTYARLEGIAADRPNFRCVRIENTGWPCIPRNTGVDLAVGEYVLFLDHDDQIAPRTLEAAWRLGHRNRADAVNIKESRTHLAGWALPIFDRNYDNALDRKDHNPLGPLTPHKLYRRAFLNAYGIRFPDVRGRLINEDLYFNIDVLSHAAVISILSDEAAYHWVTTGANSSDTFFKDQSEQLPSMEQVLSYAREKLAHRPALLEHVAVNMLNSQVLPYCAELGRKGGAEWDHVAPRLRQLLDQFVNERVERRLHIKRAAILALVRSGRIDLLDELDQLDSGLYGKGAATSVRWIAGQLHLKARVAWYSDQAAAPSLRVDDNRLVLDVSPELAHALPSRLVDVTDAVQRAEGTFAVRSRDTAASWLVPTTNRRHIETPAVDGHTLTIDAETDLDIDGAMQGHPLTDPLWDVFLNAGYLAGHQQRRLSVDPMPRAVALIKGRCAIAYRTQRGTLALDMDQVFGDVVRDGGALLERATVERRGRAWLIRVPLMRVHVHGDTTIPVDAIVVPHECTSTASSGHPGIFRAIRLRRTKPDPVTTSGAVRGAAGAAWLEIRLSHMPARTTRMSINSGHRTVEVGFLTSGPKGDELRLVREIPRAGEI